MSFILVRNAKAMPLAERKDLTFLAYYAVSKILKPMESFLGIVWDQLIIYKCVSLPNGKF